MSDELLLLGLLSGSAMHGYQLNEVIEKRLPMLWDLKPSTAYSRLDRLAARGLVATTTQRIGRRPERKVYELTAEGRERFLELLRENMRSASTDSQSADLGILFSRALPAGEVQALLRERRAATAERRPHLIEMIARHPAESPGRRISERSLVHLDVELEWLDGVLAESAEAAATGTHPAAP
ncbi:MAG: PadR family transcriptional regulator [Dehalococcoidia bacterium]